MIIFVGLILKLAKHCKPPVIFRFPSGSHIVMYSQVHILISSSPCLPNFHAVVFMLTLFMLQARFSVVAGAQNSTKTNYDGKKLVVLV